MARDEQYNVRVNAEEKASFEEYIEETHEYRSVAQMFRSLAHSEVKGHEQGAASIDPDEMRDVVDEALDPLAERIADIDDQMATMAARVSDDDEIDKLARQVFHALPEHQSGEEMHSPVESFHIADAEDRLPSAQLASTPTAWARYFGVSTSKMRRACGTMLEAYPDAQYYEDQRSDGMDAPERRYYKTN